MDRTKLALVIACACLAGMFGFSVYSRPSDLKRAYDAGYSKGEDDGLKAARKHQEVQMPSLLDAAEDVVRLTKEVRILEQMLEIERAKTKS